ncbi:MAG: hypothetical protein U0L18_05380, partial [Acutalibacteraceae bacterium]|nr:hypothetical protein [Acutalibacteraceae bacterium]
MAINNQPTIKPRTVTGLFTKHIAKVIPLAFDESMSYYECICALLDYINKNVIPALDNNAEGLEELQEFYIELQSYVNNYFDNLDVQEEINNKLDDMVKDGTIDQIIEQYLNSSAIWGFDTVVDMKEATNLIDGSYAKTLGYHSKNDGGMATYKIRTITNDDVVDEMTIISLSDNTLVAELICEEYNLASLGSTDEIDISTKLQTFIDSKDNITLYVPDGTYKLNIVLKNKNMKIYGNGTIKGSIEQNTTIIDNVLPECYNIIKGISFTKDVNDYAIKLDTGRNFKIENVNIDDTFTYGIYYYKQSSFSQRVSKAIISNNIIYAKNGLYLSDTSTLGLADITFTNNILYSEICNVYLEGIDGFKDSNNIYFMPGYSKQSNTKTYNFYANRINWLTINGSTLFEAGYNSIHLTKYQNVNITNNLIGWCGQRVRSAGVYLGDYDVTGSGLYNITSVSNNIINAPTLHGIEVTTNTGRISINNNRIHNAGSSAYYYGETDTTQAYAINYPLVNENMYCNVSNNICENKENNLSARIFKSNNITNSSKSSAYRLTEEVTISDTFAANSATSKSISYTLPTGYIVNNIRVKTMNPLSHGVQYDITIIGNVAIIRNNYSS